MEAVVAVAWGKVVDIVAAGFEDYKNKDQVAAPDGGIATRWGSRKDRTDDPHDVTGPSCNRPEVRAGPCKRLDWVTPCNRDGSSCLSPETRKR